MRCPECGVEVVEQAVFCHKCGGRIEASADNGPVNAQPAGDPGPAAPDFLQEAAVRREKAAEPEKELWRGGYSSKAMIGAWVLSGLIDVVLLTVGIYAGFGATGWLILVAAMLLPWLYHAAVLCYRRMSVSYRLTTQRFIHELGLLRRVNNRIELLDMDDITFEQGLLERLVGVGTIRIGSSDRTDPELVLPGIENVKEVAAILDNARLAERRRRGVHIEQI